MSLQGELLIRQINNLTVARYAAAAGIPWVSFCFDKNAPAYVSPAIAKEIKDWLSGPSYLAEFGDTDFETVTTICAHLEITHVMVKEPDLAQMLIERGFQVWLPVSSAAKLNCFAVVVEPGKEFLSNETAVTAWALNEPDANWPDAASTDIIMLPGLKEDKTGFVDFEPFDRLLEKIGY